MEGMATINDDGRPVMLVTGGTSGIGRATARMLAAQGNHVIAAGLDAADLPEQETLGDGELITCNMDVIDPDQVHGIIATLPRLDAVIHCAGFGIAGSAECTPMALARRQFDVNYFGVLQVNSFSLPLLRRTAARNHRPGRVIVVGSIGGRVGLPFQSHYSSTKAALEMYVEALRLEGMRHGIIATIVEPGDLATGFTGSRITAEPDDSPYAEECRRSIARMAHDERTGAGPETVARVIVRALAARRPPVRVTVGASYRALMQLKRILPDRLVEAIMRRIYM